MKKLISQLLLIFGFTVTLLAQTNSGQLEAGISSPSSNNVVVQFINTSGGAIPGTGSYLVVYVKIPLTGTNNPSVAINSTNPYSLGPSVTFDFNNYRYFGFEAGVSINLTSVFPANVLVNILGLSVSEAGSVEVVGDDFGAFFNDPNYAYSGTALATGAIFDNNVVAWPIISSVSLPIRLQSFTAKKFAANTSLLEWTTASEENASHIEIERSMDAQSWTYVATEKARGSLNYSTDYSYVDAEAVLQRDRFTTVYYRLKLVDLDGKVEYSEVRSVTFDNNGIVSLEAYPNPSTEVFNLRMAVGETNTNTAQMLMLDMSGKLVKKQTVSANGISTVEVDQLETGVYNIIVKHENNTYQKRVIKTN